RRDHCHRQKAASNPIRYGCNATARSCSNGAQTIRNCSTCRWRPCSPLCHPLAQQHPRRRRARNSRQLNHYHPYPLESRPMNRLHLFAFLSLILLSACGGKPEFETLSGDKGRFEDFRGRWLLINYWAEWCAPCIKEMPELKKFSDTYGQQAVILTVNFDGASGDTLRE